MQDEDKTKRQLITELRALRQRLSEWDKAITECKRAEQTLRESEERFKALAQASFEGIGLTDGGVIIDANPQLAQMLGYDLSEIAGKPVADMIAPEDRELVSYFMEAEYEGCYENRVLRKDGSKLVVETQAKHFAYQGRNVRVTAVRDITERKKAEDALAEEAIRRRILFEQSRDGIVVLDLNGKVYEANQRYTAMLGYSAEEIGQLYVWDWDVNWTQADLLERMRLANEEGAVFETRHRRKDGTIYDVEISSNGVELNGQKLVFCVCRDISRRKAAEQALLVSEAKFRSYIESAPLAIFVADRQGRLVDFNPAAAELLGYDAGTLRKMHIMDLHPEDDREEVLSNFATLLKVGHVRIERRMKRCDGQLIWVSLCVVMTSDQLSLGYCPDITEQRRAAEALRESETKFRTLFEAMTEGVALQEIIYDERGMALDYRIISTNPAFEKHTELKSEQVLGQLASKVYGMDHAPDLERYALVASSGQPDSFETYFPLLDRHFYISVTSPKRGYFVTVFENITERKRSEDALQAAHEQLKGIIEFLPDATFVIDRDGKVIAWNRAIEKMTGVPKEKMIGMGDYAYGVPFYGEPRPILIDLVTKGIDGHIDLYDFIEQHDKLLSGEVFAPKIYGGKGAYLWGTASPLFDMNEELIGAVQAIRDVTELRQIESSLLKREADLREKAHQLEEINTALKVLLRRREEDKKDLEESLLTNVKESVLPFLEKLKKTRLDENQKTYLGIVESQLVEIVSPFLKSLSSRFTDLTPMEIKVAKLIKEGKSSKEIAEIFGVAEQTILTHRNNLRAKLGLRNEKANLRSHLMSLP
jgi:PAS domain S-box-containing protein